MQWFLDTCPIGNDFPFSMARSVFHGIFTYFYMSSVTPRLEILPRSIAAALPWSRCPAPPRSRAPRCRGNPVDPWQTSATRLVVDHWSQKATWSNKVLKLMHIGKACEIMMVSYGSWWFMMVWYFRTFGYFWGQRHPKVIEGFVTTWFGLQKRLQPGSTNFTFFRSRVGFLAHAVKPMG